MRKPRDYDAELKTLNDRATHLKQRKVQQLGELIIATGADALALEILAGALLAAAKEKNAAAREGWREAGAAFFQRSKANARGNSPIAASGAPNSSGTLAPDGGKVAL